MKLARTKVKGRPGAGRAGGRALVNVGEREAIRRTRKSVDDAVCQVSNLSAECLTSPRGGREGKGRAAQHGPASLCTLIRSRCMSSRTLSSPHPPINLPPSVHFTALIRATGIQQYIYKYIYINIMAVCLPLSCKSASESYADGAKCWLGVMTHFLYCVSADPKRWS